MNNLKTNRKLLYGVGINDADYVVDIRKRMPDYTRKIIFQCHFYITWSHMLRRCYSQKHQAKYPAYKDCKVSDEWLRFSNFKAWMETQEWEGKQLDKDILGDGKLYSVESCCFVDQAINKFLTNDKGTGDFPAGVHFSSIHNIFVGQVNNPFTKRREVKYFSGPELAHAWWKARKVSFATEYSKTLPKHVGDALIDRYKNYKSSGF